MPDMSSDWPPFEEWQRRIRRRRGIIELGRAARRVAPAMDQARRSMEQFGRAWARHG